MPLAASTTHSLLKQPVMDARTCQASRKAKGRRSAQPPRPPFYPRPHGLLYAGKPSPFTEMVASACVIAQLELLRSASKLLGWVADEQ